MNLFGRHWDPHWENLDFAVGMVIGCGMAIVVMGMLQDWWLRVPARCQKEEAPAPAPAVEVGPPPAPAAEPKTQPIPRVVDDGPGGRHRKRDQP